MTVYSIRRLLATKWQKIQIKLPQKIRTVLTKLTESWKVDLMLQETKSRGSGSIACEFPGSALLSVLTSSSEGERCLCNSHPLLTISRRTALSSCVLKNVSTKSQQNLGSGWCQLGHFLNQEKGLLHS